MVRFVGEDPRDAIAEGVADLTGVGVMGHFDVAADGFLRESIEVGVPVVPGAVRSDDFAEDEEIGPFGQVGRDPVPGDGAQVPHAVVLDDADPGAAGPGVPCEVIRFAKLQVEPPLPVAFLASHQSSRRAGGPAILVVEPRLHPQALGLVNAGLHEAHPLLGEVRGGEA